MSKPDLFSHLDRYNEVVSIFQLESDRAAAILGASYLDTLLEKLLRTKLIDHAAVNELFSGQGALASFSAKILMAFSLRLFHEGIYHDLTLIRRIRNQFAHNIEEATFSEPAIRDRCADFWFVKELAKQQPTVEHGPRDRFLLAVSSASLSMTAPFHSEWLAYQLSTPTVKRHPVMFAG